MSNTIVTSINYTVPTQQEYKTDDILLIQSTQITTEFNPNTDNIEVFIYDLNNQIVATDYNFINYQTYQDSVSNIGPQFVLNNIKIDPAADLESYFLDAGEYIINYNFYREFLSSSVDTPFFIKEISPSRTELRLDTNYLNNNQLVSASAEFSSSRFGRQFDDFYLNLGDNNLLIANNFLLDTTTEDYSVLVKLYEPLPERFGLKSQTWVVDKISDPSSFQVEFIFEPIILTNAFQLQGPNLNLNFKDQINNSNTFQTYDTILSSSLTSSQQQYISILQEKAININIDFNNFNNFVHFSSAEKRLNNFFYKIQEIENYTNDLKILTTLTYNSQVSSSKNTIETNINSIIANFDEYEYYLYYDSGSNSWPKSTSTKPYILYSTTSSQVLNWYGSINETSAYYGGQILSASNFDQDNPNYLFYAVPEYLRSNLSNESYILFIDMIGQLFDNIWIYYKDVTNKYNADNRLDFGVSKDLIAEVIRDLGIKIYQNNFSSQDVFSAFLGINPQGGLFPSTGSELITSYITSSNEMTPLDDIEKSIYKRIYHNIPYLLKTKGTTIGLQTIISMYGIPDTILRVAEFGGKDKDESNDWDYFKQRYNFKLDTRTNPSVSTKWTLNSNWGSADNVPNTLQFRFKLPSSGSTGAVNLAVSNPSQSLWSLNNGNQVALVLEYTGSGFSAGSYSGSIVNPYYQYANLKLITDGANTSASVYLPFFNGDWWSVMVTRNSNNFTLYAADNIYNGDDGSTIGFIASSSIIGANPANWTGSLTSSFGATGSFINISGKRYNTFSGSYQEIRYYTVGLSSSAFEDYTMNPDSIEGNFLNSAPDQLAFRASLGGELFTGSVSIHPKVTGSFSTTSSFASDSNFTTGSSVFTSNVETVYLDQPAAGIKNIVSNKIQILPTILAKGNVTGDQAIVGNNMLSPYRSIQQLPPGGNIYTENLAYTEIAFSPQNEINDDIMDQLGFFNMGEFIGDPRQRFTLAESYPNLDVLRNNYFKKYTGNYNIFEYVNLIKYFDNSLFKMVQDFTPARTSLASGIIVKQHLLERNKYPQPEVTQSLNDYSGSINTAFILGGAGGSVNNLNGLNTNPYYIANGLSNVYGVTQSWSESIVNPYGLDVQIHSSQDEFYNGEFSGSYIDTDKGGELNLANPFKQVPTIPTNYTLNLWGLEFGTSEGTFLNTVVPSPGTASFWSQDATLVPASGVAPYIQWAKIHSTDLQGNNNSLSLEALETLVTNYSKTRGPFIIISISPRNSGAYYVLEFAPGNAAYTFPGPPSGNVPVTNQQLVFSPYITSESGPFQNSDYNAIINNAIPNRLSEWYQQVDYATAQTLPVNFQQLISGTAAPASVQDSNYTSYQYSGIRYWGSKNTTDNFNSPLTITSSIVQTYQNDNLGLTTLGYASVNSFDTGIYEFAWGGGTYPEIATGGAVKLSQILNVTNTSSVGIISPLTNYFSGVVDQDLPANSQPQFTQYSTTANIPNTARVMTSDFGVPTISNYMVSSTTGPSSVANISGVSTIGFTNTVSRVTTNTSGFYITGSTIPNLTMSMEISNSLASGDKWYVTLYENLPNPVQGTLEPINSGSLNNYSIITRGSYNNPVLYNGVFEISTSISSSLTFYDKLPINSGSFGNGSNGMLVWKAIVDGTFVLFNGTTLSGVGKGNLITPTASPTIKDNLTYITQTYGTNPKN
jgi:hypothetical protein